VNSCVPEGLAVPVKLVLLVVLLLSKILEIEKKYKLLKIKNYTPPLEIRKIYIATNKNYTPFSSNKRKIPYFWKILQI